MSKSLKLKDNNYLDTSAIVHKRNNLRTILEKTGGINYVLNSQGVRTMVKPSSSYNRYVWYINHPACLKKLTSDKHYTLSFKFIPEAEGYVPMESIVVGGIDGVDAWRIRLLPSYFSIDNYDDYQIWSCSFTIQGNGTHYLQDHIGFILESSSSNIGGKIYEMQLEEGFLKSDWKANIEDLNYMYGSNEIPFEYNTDKYNGSLRYIVKNGVCYLHVFFRTLIPQAGWTFVFSRSDVVPRPVSSEMGNFGAITQINKAPVRFVVQGDGNIACHGGEASDTDYVGNFVYPCV